MFSAICPGVRGKKKGLASLQGLDFISLRINSPATERAANRQDVLEADPDAWERDAGKRRREVTGWVVLTSPWLEWLWSHVNYHEVHHKFPWLSHVDLKAAFEATRRHEPYLVVGGYWRSLFNIARSRYYETQERTRPFLSTR